MKLEFIEAGQIVTTHGVRGDIKVLCWLDGPDMLCGLRRCRIEGREYTMEAVRVQKTCNLVKLKGIDTMEAGQSLRGKTLEIWREDLNPELIFTAELIGVDVYADGVLLGKLADVLDYPGNKVYVIQGEAEHMIPAVKQYILSTDLADNRMEVKLIEGMRSDED